MRNQARYLRLPLVALAAIVGMLWGAADASASTTHGVLEVLLLLHPRWACLFRVLHDDGAWAGRGDPIA